MGMKRLPPQAINWATPQWQHAASGIRCRADWRNAWVYDTEVGLIIAYSQKHANDRAVEVMEEQDAMNEQLHDEIEDLLL
jgi:hypothetical protein